MRRSQLFITLLFLALLLTAAFLRPPIGYGALSWLGLGALLAGTVLVGFVLVATDTAKGRKRVLGTAEAEAKEAAKTTTKKLPEWVKTTDISYPHPQINAETCIGCHACVDACPQDVLAIVNGKAASVRLDQCVEDTSCQVECPTVPKSCIVVNTNKKIAVRKVPTRDPRFMTDVPGVFLIGDVSGVPLIKNAINEGGAVIDYIKSDLASEGRNPNAEYDVAVIGIGPGGLSAAVLAKQRGLKYIAIEQNQVVDTIQSTYPNGKYVFFNPAEQAVKGGIRLDGPGNTKEAMIGAWTDAMTQNGVVVNERESCKKVAKEDGLFVVHTVEDKSQQSRQYCAQKVIIAVGNRGTPARLRVKGEDLKINFPGGEEIWDAACTQCNAARRGQNMFCQQCGAKYVPRITEAIADDKVKYKLTDPNSFQGRHCIVVGAGNSAIEAAVDLAAYRDEAGTKIVGWRDNTVTLVIRSDFKSDLKLGNKMMCYECIDEGHIKVHLGETIKEITEHEVLLMSARERKAETAKETARIKNDYVFALIGGEKPTKFLEEIGVKIG